MARKWRPKQFSEVLGQEHITRTLKNSVLNKKIAHAYLLTGTRGIGKTSIARVFAKAIRCENLSETGEPCLVCQSCEDIEKSSSINYIEIDGASNNSVENIRDLIETVQYLPSSGAYKIYVIDEVHMLSVSAFNALLKTLEEPPKHVVFIFATTDPQKLLGTVLSRCQRFDFKNSTVEELNSHLNFIAKKEGFSFSDPKLSYEISRQAKGSVRDALSLLDQVLALSEDDVISEDVLNLSLGLVNSSIINQLIKAIYEADQKQIKMTFDQMLTENIDLEVFTHQLLDLLYQELMLKSQDQSTEFSQNLGLVELMWVYENLSKDLQWSLESLTPTNNVCFSLIKVATREKIVTLKKKQISKASEVEEKVEQEISPHSNETLPPQEPLEKTEAPEQGKKNSWSDFVAFLFTRNKSLALNVERGNVVSMQDGNVRIAFGEDCKIFYDFLDDPERKMDIKALIAEFFDINITQVKITFELLDDKAKEQTNFKSSVEIAEGIDKQDRENKTQEILNSKYIKDAESLFSSKVQKVILNNDENS